MKSRTGHDQSLTDKIKEIFASVVRTTVRLIKNFPSYVKNKIQRKITEYKRKPKRDDVNKVYVLVGYTTKEHIDAKHNAERNLIILRNGLIAIITLLILFISINAILPHIDFDQYGEMFGIKTVEEVTRNDPFSASVPSESVTSMNAPQASSSQPST